MELGRLIVRLVVGLLFVGHGTQKLFGWFNGPGPEGTEQMMGALDLHPARRNAQLAGLTETLGGTGVALGAATPLAAAGLIGTMVTAIRKVHLQNGPWVSNGGYEYNLVLIALLAGLADSGPGRPSIDALLGTERTGARWALGALAVGAAASTAVVAAGKGEGPPDAGLGMEPTGEGEIADATGDVAGDPTTVD